MSRTYAHVPANVEFARNTNPRILRTRHVPGLRVSDGRYICVSTPVDVLPDWASHQPWTRHGHCSIERRGAVRDVLRVAAQEYRAIGAVTGADVMPDPDRYCLCQMCGTND